MVLNNYKIGEFRQTATFKINHPSALGSGQVDGYVTLLQTRCRLRKMSGSRGLGFGLIASNDSYEMIVRYQGNIEGSLRMDVKIDIDSKRYTINSWEKIDQIAHLYKFSLNLETV
jgi:hypothetical protein